MLRLLCRRREVYQKQYTKSLLPVRVMERKKLSFAPHHAISENASLVWLAFSCTAVIE
jgi:hypothetical protein